jgi:two-component system, NtrC family, sensor histidine kinase PilS
MTEPNPVSDERLFRNKLKKVLFCRLLLTTFLLLLILAVQGSRKEDLRWDHLYPLYIFACVVFLCTLLAVWRIERTKHPVRFAWTQILFEIAAVSVLVFLSGGIDSSFSFLYLLVIISSALLLYRRGSILTASLCGFAYGLLLDLQYFEWISPLRIIEGAGYARDSGTYFLHILMNIAGFYLVALLAGYLGEELLKSSRRVREHEKNLHRLSTLHQNIVHSMTSGLLTIDLNHTIIFFNNAAQKMLGLPSEAINARPLDRIFPGLAFKAVKAAEEGQSSRSGRMEAAYRHPSGDEICLGYSVSVLKTESEEPFGWVLIFKDLTQLKAIQEHMQRMERMVFAGKIAAEIAHENKNPLAAMSGAVQMLQGEIGDHPLQAKLMGIVQREIGRINELVTDFLWLAKGPPKPAQVEEVSVCSIIEEILALLKAKHQIAPSHSIHTAFNSNPVLSIDPHHLRQILWNIFANALEAMPASGDLCISVSFQNCTEDASTNEVRLDIADTGCGIPDEVRKKIFDPFFTTKATGTGLGLSIVYQMIEEAGGRIEINPNSSGAGTVFSLFFPATKPFLLAK